MDNTIKYLSGITGIIFSFLFGEINVTFTVLVTLSAIDFVSGIMSGYINKELDSRKCSVGIIKKFFIYVIVALSHLLDVSIGSSVLMNAVVFFYIANEGMSILENAGSCGVEFPKKITDALKQLNEGGKNDK